MTKLETLYRLVQKMTASEKRYFSLYAQLGSGRTQGNYLHVYAVLEGARQFDEASMRTRLQTGAAGKILPSTLTRLMDLILRSLRAMRSDKSIPNLLHALLEDADLLVGKGLEIAALSKLEKGIALAKDYEKEGKLQEMLLKKVDILWRLGKASPEQLAELRKEVEASTARMTQQNQLEMLHAEARMLALQRIRIRKGEASPFDDLLRQPLIAAASLPHSMQARAYVTDIRGICDFTQGDFARAYAQYADVVPEWDARPDRIACSPQLYLSLLNNYLTSCLFSGDKFDAFEAAIDRLEAVKGLPDAVRFRKELITFAQRQLYTMHYLYYAEGVLFVQQFEQWEKQHSASITIPRKLTFYYNIVSFYFVYGEFRQGYHWLVRILNLPGREGRKDIRDFARVFQLIFQYEFGEVDLNAYLARSAHRYFFRSEKLHAFETALISFVQDSMQSIQPGDHQACFQALRRNLESIQGIQTETNPHGLQELLLWTEARLKQVPIRSLFEPQIADNRKASGKS